MSEPLRVVATLNCKPGTGIEAVAAIRDCVRETRKEAGCLDYAAYRSDDQPDRVTFVELWESQAALDAHNKSAHLGVLVEAIKPLITSQLEILVLKQI